MELQDIYFVAEIVGVVAIIGSLIFVGAQMRQNTDATRASNAQAAQTGWNELSVILATNNDLFDTMKGGTIHELGLSDLDDAEVRLYYYMNAGMKLLENNYLQWLEGNLSDDLWQGFRGTLVHHFAVNDYWLTYWQGSLFNHSTKFQNLVTQLIEEAETLRSKMIAEAKASQS